MTMSFEPQKFFNGDLVESNTRPVYGPDGVTRRAVVVGSYADQFPSGREGPSRDNHLFTLHFEDGEESSWHDDSGITLLERSRTDLLESWRVAEKVLRDQRSDLDWVFANGTEVLEQGYGSSIQALAKCFGLNDLWGRHGEGWVYQQNALGTLALAQPFLRRGDKTGWLEFAKTFTPPPEPSL